MKRRIPRVFTYVLSVLLFWAIAAPSAHAYIDPGSTNFIIQIVIGALAGAGLAIATFWRRIRTFFSRNKTEPSATSPAAAPPPATPPSAIPPASTETPARPEPGSAPPSEINPSGE